MRFGVSLPVKNFAEMRPFSRTAIVEYRQRYLQGAGWPSREAAMAHRITCMEAKRGPALRWNPFKTPPAFGTENHGGKFQRKLLP